MARAAGGRDRAWGAGARSRARTRAKHRPSPIPPSPQPAATAAQAVTRKASGTLEIDDGERPLEKAYIEACVFSGNVEALFYALQRKRARLARGGFEAALARHEATWGDLVRELEERAGGPFGEGARADAADADADDADGAKGTEWEIDARNLPGAAQ